MLTERTLTFYEKYPGPPRFKIAFQEPVSPEEPIEVHVYSEYHPENFPLTFHPGRTDSPTRRMFTDDRNRQKFIEWYGLCAYELLSVIRDSFVKFPPKTTGATS